MKLSKRGEYALRALIDLGVAAELGRPIVQVSELVAKEKLPTKFLEQIFIQLKAGGYVSTTRGKFGGYSLAKPARKIRFGEVVRLIEGPLAPIACTSVTSYVRCTCPDEAHCGLRMLMLDVRNAIARILDRNTLEDIVEITLRKLRRDKLISPFESDPRQGLPPLPAELQMFSANRGAERSPGDQAKRLALAGARANRPPLRKPAAQSRSARVRPARRQESASFRKAR